MTVLFKVPPVEPNGDLLTLEAKPYGVVTLTRGDRVFLWWSETQGGAGLVGHGLCHEARFDGIVWRAAVEVIDDRFRGFGKANLANWRNAGCAIPPGTLSAKLYRNSHNKVVAITELEAAFLNEVLEGADVRAPLS